MGNGYHPHQLHQQNLQFNHYKLTFLPILCSKPSIKDVSHPKFQDKSGDPLSPKIGCMGQVKRNNKIVGCPVSQKFNNNSYNNGGGIKYFKLKKLFSGKNLITTITTTPSIAAATTATTGCRRKQVCRASRDEKENSGLVNIENMDPPLPVIKRVVVPKQGDKDGDTLWKRRSRGVGLKSLQLEQIQLTRHEEPNTV